ATALWIERRAGRSGPASGGGRNPRRFELQRANAIGEIAAFVRCLVLGLEALAVGGWRFTGKQGFDRRVAAVERNRQPRDLGGSVVDPFAQDGIFHAFRRPGLLGLALHRGDLLLQLALFSLRLGELILHQGLFLDEIL